MKIAGRQLIQLKADAEKSQQHAFAAGTYKNLKCQWVKYLLFCQYFKINPFPANEAILSWYAQYLTKTLKSHASIVAYLSGLKTLHKLLEYDIRGFSGFLFKLTLQGIRRLSKHIVKQARPMTPTLLRAIHKELNHDNEEDKLFRAVCITAFFLLFRKSNLIPDKTFGFEIDKQLARKDIYFTNINAVVGIRWSKTHQFSRELLTFPLPRLDGSVLCPVRALRNVLDTIPGKPEAHLFARSDGSSLTYRQFHDKLRLVLGQVGVQYAEQYSSHSFRRGGCTFSFLCGIPILVIKTLGSWRSDCFLKYIEFPLESRTAASELMKQGILSWEKTQPLQL